MNKQQFKEIKETLYKGFNATKPFAKVALSKTTHIVFAFMAISMLMGSYTRRLLVHCLNEWLRESQLYLNVETLLTQEYIELELELHKAQEDSKEEELILDALIQLETLFEDLELDTQLKEMRKEEEAYPANLTSLPHAPSVKGYAYTLAYLLAEEAKFIQLDKLVEKGWQGVQTIYKVLRASVRWTVSGIFVYMEQDYQEVFGS